MRISNMGSDMYEQFQSKFKRRIRCQLKVTNNGKMSHNNICQVPDKMFELTQKVSDTR